MQTFDILILGSGPSGLTAAIYTSRAFLKTLIIGGNPPGGQLTLTSEVENFPGFPAGITGTELITNMREQAKKFGTEFADENVTKLSGSVKDGFTVETEGGKTFVGKSVIVATGASAKWLNLESEQRLRGKGVSACATCDGFFFKNKIVAVVGDGDSAMEESTFLTKFATKVYVIAWCGLEEMKASKIMRQKALDNPKIEVLFNSEVREVLGTDKVSGLKIENNQTKEERVLSGVEGLFVAIGHQPNTNFLKGFIDLDDLGFIKASGVTKTSVEGIFVAGDVADAKYMQAITAAGLGGMAALDAQRFLQEHGVESMSSAY